MTDTYVKTSLVDGTKRLHRKKTKPVKMSLDPMYRQIIKYSACNVHGRYMQVRKQRIAHFLILGSRKHNVLEHGRFSTRR